MGVYNHLGGKDGLIDALLTRGFDRLRAAVEPGDEPDMLDRLRNAQLRLHASSPSPTPTYCTP